MSAVANVTALSISTGASCDSIALPSRVLFDLLPMTAGAGEEVAPRIVGLAESLPDHGPHRPRTGVLTQSAADRRAAAIGATAPCGGDRRAELVQVVGREEVGRRRHLVILARS